MGIFNRLLNIRKKPAQKSLFLFGPRQTGKTFLLKQQFPESLYYNLLKADVFRRLSQRPEILREELMQLKEDGKLAQRGPIIIDEIQKLPLLLDEVHNLIEEIHCAFILTGSSARKLKRGGANLLGGRAWTYHLFPLVTAEIPRPELLRILNFGSIPSIYQSETPQEDLEAYVGTYLQEEIAAEALTRKIDNFSRFLTTAAIMNGELLNFANVGSDAEIPPRTVREYYDILEDTLVGTLLRPYTKTTKRKAISTAKFYMFDVGVANILAGRVKISPKTELFGKALEHFLFTELKAFLSYKKLEKESPLSFWRSTSGFEVDFLLGDHTAIEVKASSMVVERHLAGLKALAEEIKLRKKIIVSTDKSPRKIGDVQVLPVMDFLQRLWGGELFS